MANPIFATPIYSDPITDFFGTTTTPTYSKGNWSGTLPLVNVQDRKLSLVARSASAAKNDTVFLCDLQTDRAVRVPVLPKHTISSAGLVRFVGYPSSVLFDYEAGDNLAAKGATFARSGTATYTDTNGVVQTAATGVARDAHYIGGNRHLLLECASTNLLLRSQEFENAGAWGASDATRTANTAAAPDGTTTADTIDDTSAGATQQANQSIAVANDSTIYTVSAFLKQNTSRFPALVITLSGGTAVSVGVVADLTAGTIANIAGTGAPLRSSITALANGWYRISVTAANNSTGNVAAAFQLFPAWNTTQSASASATATGSVYAWGATLEAQPSPTSYVATTTATATRNADTISFTYTPIPQAMTVYTKGVSYRASPFDGSLLWEIGTAAGTRLSCSKTNAGASFTGTHKSAAGTVTSVGNATVLIGDTVETRTILTATGTIAQADSANGAAETVGTTSAANALDGAWAATTLYLNADASAANIGVHAFRSVRITTAAPTLATIQGLVYDSGWFSPWPAGLTTEEVVGLNFAALPTTLPASTLNNTRYWWTQIDDTTNPAGYIDIARAVFAGSYQPSEPIAVGSAPGLDSDTTRSKTPGGSALYDTRPVFREDAFKLPATLTTELLASVRKMLRLLNKSGQLFFIFDPSDTTYGYERNYLGVFKDLGQIQYSSGARCQADFSIIEEL